MNNRAKIHLSAYEMELVNNADWILTKNAIIEKTKHLLEYLMPLQQNILLKYDLPKEVITIPPKISKGEYYKGLPYLVLDLPRYFEKGNHFAIRTMFWWGNFFSVTLHLSGLYKLQYERSLKRAFTDLRDQGYFICTSAEEWEHHFEDGNYSSVKDIKDQEFFDIINTKNFLKLSIKFPLAEWNDLPGKIMNSFRELVRHVAG